MKSGCWCLMREGSTELVVRDLIVADSFWTRLAGLQFRRKLPPESALLLVPGGSIHTIGVLFSLDVVMLDRAGMVLEVRRGVPPFRVVAAPKGTHAVLEMVAGSCTLVRNEKLQVVARRESPVAPLPRSLQFLLC